MTIADTNVLVHATVPTSPDHHRAFASLDRAVAAGRVSITRQIVREYLAVLTRPQAWAEAVRVSAAMELADALAARFPVLEDGPEVWGRLRHLADRYTFGGKQVHDANIVATMLAYGHTRLLTFNLGDFRRYEPLIEVVPA